MEKHFIKTVSFKNFKCFEELDVKDIKRVNLIAGKNNIGKTAFMEGVELIVSSKDAIDLSFNISKMMERRQYRYCELDFIMERRQYRCYELDFIYENSSYVELKTDNKKISIEYIENNSLEEYQPALKLNVNSDEKIVTIEEIANRICNLPFIRRNRYDSIKSRVNFIKSVAMNEREIAILYGDLIDLNKEEFLNSSLQLFDENIMSLKQKATNKGIILKVALKDREFPVLLSSLGEGINRYIAILCAIWASKDGYLFIDEIENGIHFTNYEKLWEIIFEASKMANCQVFVTTHSKECIEAFNRANVDNEGSFLEFYRNKKNKIVVKTRDKEVLDYSLSHSGRIRGE